MDLADTTARLLGVSLSREQPRRDSGSSQTSALAERVATALGISRPAGDDTLLRVDNGGLRDLLEARVLLATESGMDAIDGALNASLLILADWHAGADTAGARNRSISFITADDGSRALCAFSHRDCLRQYAQGRAYRTWVTPAPRLWQFAMPLGRGVLLDPGQPHCLNLDPARIARLGQLADER